VGRLQGHNRLLYERQGQHERLSGKILWVRAQGGVPGLWAYRRDLKPDNLLRSLDGFALDLPVLERLEQGLVDEVHYKYAGHVYAITLARLRHKGIRWDRGGRSQLALPRSYWTRRPDYPQERIPETRREVVDIP
jgi:hypothetical protein